MSQLKTNKSEQEAILAEIEKELQAETSKETAPLLEFVLEHIQKIIMGLVAIVLIIVAISFWQWRAETNLATASTEFQKILAMQDLTARSEALAAFAHKAPKGLNTAIMLEEARAFMQNNELELASAKLEEVLKKEKNSALASVLVFALADIYMANNEAEKSLAVLENYLKAAPQSIQANLLEEIGFISEKLGNTERAISAYTALLLLPNIGGNANFYTERLVELSK